MNKSINESGLNREQFERLKSYYIDRYIDNMSVESLKEYVANDMADFVDKLTEHDLIEEIKYTLDEEFLDEFIKQIKGKITD